MTLVIVLIDIMTTKNIATIATPNTELITFVRTDLHHCELDKGKLEEIGLLSKLTDTEIKLCESTDLTSKPLLVKYVVSAGDVPMRDGDILEWTSLESAVNNDLLQRNISIGNKWGYLGHPEMLFDSHGNSKLTNTDSDNNPPIFRILTMEAVPSLKEIHSWIIYTCDNLGLKISNNIRRGIKYFVSVVCTVSPNNGKLLVKKIQNFDQVETPNLPSAGILDIAEIGSNKQINLLTNDRNRNSSNRENILINGLDGTNFTLRVCDFAFQDDYKNKLRLTGLTNQLANQNIERNNKQMLTWRDRNKTVKMRLNSIKPRSFSNFNTPNLSINSTTTGTTPLPLYKNSGVFLGSIMSMDEIVGYLMALTPWTIPDKILMSVEYWRDFCNMHSTSSASEDIMSMDSMEDAADVAMVNGIGFNGEEFSVENLPYMTNREWSAKVNSIKEVLVRCSTVGTLEHKKLQEEIARFNAQSQATQTAITNNAANTSTNSVQPNTTQPSGNVNPLQGLNTNTINTGANNVNTGFVNPLLSHDPSTTTSNGINLSVNTTTQYTTRQLLDKIKESKVVTFNANGNAYNFSFSDTDLAKLDALSNMSTQQAIHCITQYVVTNEALAVQQWMQENGATSLPGMTNPANVGANINTNTNTANANPSVAAVTTPNNGNVLGFPGLTHSQTNPQIAGNTTNRAMPQTSTNGSGTSAEIYDKMVSGIHEKWLLNKNTRHLFNIIKVNQGNPFFRDNVQRMLKPLQPLIEACHEQANLNMQRLSGVKKNSADYDSYYSSFMTRLENAKNKTKEIKSSQELALLAKVMINSLEKANNQGGNVKLNDYPVLSTLDTLTVLPTILAILIRERFNATQAMRWMGGVGLDSMDMGNANAPKFGRVMTYTQKFVENSAAIDSQFGYTRRRPALMAEDGTSGYSGINISLSSRTEKIYFRGWEAKISKTAWIELGTSPQAIDPVVETLATMLEQEALALDMISYYTISDACSYDSVETTFTLNGTTKVNPSGSGPTYSGTFVTGGVTSGKASGNLTIGGKTFPTKDGQTIAYVRLPGENTYSDPFLNIKLANQIEKPQYDQDGQKPDAYYNGITVTFNGSELTKMGEYLVINGIGDVYKILPTDPDPEWAPNYTDGGIFLTRVVAANGNIVPSSTPIVVAYSYVPEAKIVNIDMDINSTGFNVKDHFDAQINTLGIGAGIINSSPNFGHTDAVLLNNTIGDKLRQAGKFDTQASPAGTRLDSVYSREDNSLVANYGDLQIGSTNGNLPHGKEWGFYLEIGGAKIGSAIVDTQSGYQIRDTVGSVTTTFPQIGINTMIMESTFQPALINNGVLKNHGFRYIRVKNPDA